MKSAIVTGANGFVGHAVIRELITEGIEVCAVVHNNNKDRLKDCPGIKVINRDVSDLTGLDEDIPSGKYDTIFHFAWDGSAGEKRADYKLQLKNVEQTLDLMQFAKDHEIKRFICAGTIMEHETILAAYKSGNKLGQNYIYGAGKTVAHMMAQSLATKIGIDLIWTEITNTYGPGEISPRLVNTTISKCINGITPEFTSGTQNYDFVYIDDLARAYYLIGAKGKPFKRYTIGSSNPKALKEFLLEMQESIAPDIKFIFGNVAFTGVDLPLDNFDTKELFEDTGFVAKVSFGEGCKRTMEWMLRGTN